MTFPALVEFTHAIFCLRHLLPYVCIIGTVGTNGITNGTIGKTLNGILSTNVTIFTNVKNSERMHR